MNRITTAALACVLCCALGGCAARPAAATITHIVLIKLTDAADRDALIADCDRLLPSIPSVASYARGEHIDTGRASVDGNYDIGLSIGFDTTDDYAAYVVHPLHMELVNAWGPRFESIRTFDLLDQSP